MLHVGCHIIVVFLASPLQEPRIGGCPLMSVPPCWLPGHFAWCMWSIRCRVVAVPANCVLQLECDAHAHDNSDVSLLVMAQPA